MANKHYLSRFMKGGFKHAHTFRRIRRHSKHVLKLVQRNHFHYFVARWRHFMKLQRKMRRVVMQCANPRLAKARMHPMRPGLRCFRTWRRSARASAAVSRKKGHAVVVMQSHWRYANMLHRLSQFTVRALRHRKVQVRGLEEARHHTLARIVAILRKRGVRPPLAKQTYRRTDQLSQQERAWRLCKAGKTLELFLRWRRRARLAAKAKRRTLKLVSRISRKRLLSGWRGLCMHSELSRMTSKVVLLRTRNVFAEWRERYRHTHMWHNASHNILFHNTGFALRRAMREWKADCKVEAMLEGYAKDVNDDKKIAVMTRLGASARKRHKLRNCLEVGTWRHREGLSNILVRELRANVRRRRAVQLHLLDMDDHRNHVRKRAAVQALVAMQIHSVSVKFRRYVSLCYTIVLPFFSFCDDCLSLSYPSIAACLLAFSDTTWHESNHHFHSSINHQSSIINHQSSIDTHYLSPCRYKQLDDMMFSFKQASNRSRYLRILGEVARTAGLRKHWMRLSYVLKRMRFKHRQADAQARDRKKPPLVAYFASMESVEKSDAACAFFQRTYCLETAVRSWFRYVVYVFCYTIVLPSFFSSLISLSLFYPSITPCLHSLTPHEV
jgi:hypothetical protein